MSLGPCFNNAFEDEQREDLETKMTAETFEAVVNAPATPEEITALGLASSVVGHKVAPLILKAIIHQMLTIDWEGTQETINECVVNHHKVDDNLTVLLDIKTVEH